MDGLLLMDKPSGCTSFDVIRQVRRITGERRIGHTGTLDPFANGLLPLCMGNATRLAGYLTLEDKWYDATLFLGIETDTLDRDGKTTRVCDISLDLTLDMIRDCLKRFVGRQLQTPPMYSAIKVKGRPLHSYAREGLEVERAPREVEIYHLELLGADLPNVMVRVHCSKGTYIRVLGAEIGKALGYGAHLTWLRRFAAGPFDETGAITPEQLEAYLKLGLVGNRLIPPVLMLPHLPLMELDAVQARRVMHGNEVQTQLLYLTEGARVRLASQGRLLAIGEARQNTQGWSVHPVTVLEQEAPVSPDASPPDAPATP